MIEKLRAQDIMIQEVHVTSRNDMVAAAKLKMMRCNVGGLPVVDKKKLVGIITHRDILLAGGEALGLKVGDLMSKDPEVAEKNTPIMNITRIMLKKVIKEFSSRTRGFGWPYHPKFSYSRPCWFR